MRKPAYLPEDKKCACGCGYPARPGSKYCNRLHAQRIWARKYRELHREHYNEYSREYRACKTQQKVVVEQVEMFASKVKSACNCHDYQHCMICRNAEKRDAYKHGRVPVYRLALLQPA